MFANRKTIPDLVPQQLLIPLDSRSRPPQRDAHILDTTTPVEVAYVFYTQHAGGFVAERQLLNQSECEGINPVDMLERGWGNHLGRVMLRAILEPERQAPISLVDIYEDELKSARFPNEDEEYFFEHFIENYGIIERS